MTKPLAIVCYERLLPGSQLANRLQDLGYRVQTIADAGLLPASAKTDKPMFIFADLKIDRGDVLGAIKSIRVDGETLHIPILAFCGAQEKLLPKQAIDAGANFVALDDALLMQLPHLVEQMLHVD